MKLFLEAILGLTFVQSKYQPSFFHYSGTYLYIFNSCFVQFNMIGALAYVEVDKYKDPHVGSSDLPPKNKSSDGQTQSFPADGFKLNVATTTGM